jgi:rRNA pseudouridine-1189 N-methylase Emg1 (Nep1/Mra1 family)
MSTSVSSVQVHYTDEQRRALFSKILALRFGPFAKGERRATWEAIAQAVGVSRQTLHAWTHTEEYRAVEVHYRSMMREEARTDASGLAQAAVDHIYYLMHNASSDFVQLEAAKTLVTITNLDKELEEQKIEGNRQLVEFQKLLLKKKRDEQTLRDMGIDPESIIDMEVGKRGSLPDAIITQNEMVAVAIRQQRKRQEDDDEPDNEL